MVCYTVKEGVHKVLYATEFQKFSPIGAPQSIRTFLTIVKKDGTRMDLFQGGFFAAIGYKRIYDQKKEVFDYLVKVTGIEGKAVETVKPIE